jgi:hypothetical protein
LPKRQFFLLVSPQTTFHRIKKKTFTLALYSSTERTRDEKISTRKTFLMSFPSALSHGLGIGLLSLHSHSNRSLLGCQNQVIKYDICTLVIKDTKLKFLLHSVLSAVVGLSYCVVVLKDVLGRINFIAH